MSKAIGYISLIFLALMFATVPAALAQSDESNPSNDTPQAVSPETSGADDQATPPTRLRMQELMRVPTSPD